MIRHTLERKSSLPSASLMVLLTCHSLINVLKAANQEVPDELLKFGTTVKRKGHEAYGAFARDVDRSVTAKKIKFD